MSNLSNTQGDGGSGGRMGREFIDTGYQTHDGQGNVPTGAQWEKGTGYDEHGQVKTAFGRFQVAYDPVTGMAVDNVTSGYSFPAGGEAGGGGLVDVSAPAEQATHATPDMQRQVQEFFAHREAGRAEEGAAGAGGGEAGAPAPPASGAAEETGQGVAERLDAGAYLEQEPTRTADEASAWRRSSGTGSETDV